MGKVSVSPGETGAQEEMGKSVGMGGGGENAFISKFRARNWPPSSGLNNLQPLNRLLVEFPGLCPTLAILLWSGGEVPA